MYVLIVTKMGLAKFLGDFLRAHPVTLAKIVKFHPKPKSTKTCDENQRKTGAGTKLADVLKDTSTSRVARWYIFVFSYRKPDQ
jgi:hypothetical protein